MIPILILCSLSRGAEREWHYQFEWLFLLLKEPWNQMLPKTGQKNMSVECRVVQIHMLARCFPKRFVLDSHRVFRLCQQTIWWVKPVGNNNFSKGEKARESRECLRNEALFFCLLTSAENYKRAPGNLLRAYFPCQVFCGGIKNHQITCQKREPPLCVLFYTLENLLITSVRDLCRKDFRIYFH